MDPSLTQQVRSLGDQNLALGCDPGQAACQELVCPESTGFPSRSRSFFGFASRRGRVSDCAGTSSDLMWFVSRRMTKVDLDRPRRPDGVRGISVRRLAF